MCERDPFVLTVRWSTRMIVARRRKFIDVFQIACLYLREKHVHE